MMDSTKLTFTEQISPTVPLKQIDKLNPDEVSEEKKKQIAKDFESLLINNLLDEMKNTIGSWGFEKDGAARQIQGIFTMYLSQHIADNGGFGLWEEIYKFLDNSANNTAESLDSKV